MNISNPVSIRRLGGLAALAGAFLYGSFCLADARAAAPVITAQPQDVTCAEGDGINPGFSSLYPGAALVRFSVSVEGGGSCTYQWQKDGVDIPASGEFQLSSCYSPHYGDTNGAVMFVTDCGMADGGQYRVKVKNDGGEVTSAPATLTVRPHAAPQVMIMHPASVTVTEAETPDSGVFFSANVTHSAPSNDTITCEWQKNGAPVTPSDYHRVTAGSVSDGGSFQRNTLSMDRPMVADSGTYCVKATNRWGYSSYSNPAVLTVLPPAAKPVISAHPADVAREVNYVGGGVPDILSSVTFAVTAGGAARYKWQKDGADLPAESLRYKNPFDMSAKLDCTAGPALTIYGPRSSDAGSYRVRVWNSAGEVVSEAATLVVTHPQAVVSGTQAVVTGRSVELVSALSRAASSAAVQWQVSNDNGATWDNVSNGGSYSGATTATLTLLNASDAMNGRKYRAMLTPSGGGTVQYDDAVAISVVPQLLPHPQGLAFDGDGNLYVTDDTLNIVKKIDLATGGAKTFAGGEGKAGALDSSGTDARFNQPRGIAFGDAGTLVVADSGNALVRGISLSGEVRTIAGKALERGTTDGGPREATFTSPEGVCATGSVIIVADRNAHTIRLVDASGTTVTLAGAAGVPGGTDGSQGLVLTGSGAEMGPPLTATVRFNHPVAMCGYVASSHGTGGEAADVALQSVSGTVASSNYWNGSLHIADSFNHTIRLYSDDNLGMIRKVSTVAGLEGVSGIDDGFGADALFNNPGGIARHDGNVYVADTGNSTIRVITAYDEVITIAGLPGVSGLRDGPGYEAMFNHPTGLALHNGKLYIADTGNAAIRALDLASGRVTTLNIIPSPAESGTSGTNPDNPGGQTGGNTGGDSGGGGGGAVSWWWAVAMVAVLALRVFVRGGKSNTV